MRTLRVLGLILLSLGNLGRAAEQPTDVDAVAQSQPGKALSAEQIDHLRKAAESLEAAGLADDAKKLRDQIAAVEQEKASELLDSKLAEMAELEREVARLRTLTGRQPYVGLHLQIVLCERRELQAKGLRLGEGALAPFRQPKSAGWTFQPFDATASQQALDTLREQHVSKPLTETTLITTYGRPAWFNDGGEFPLPTTGENSEFTIQWKKWGTQVDFVPQPRGAQGFKFDLRVRMSELLPGRDLKLADVTVPALTFQEMDTGAELDPGQSMNLAHQRAPLASANQEERASERITLVVATPETLDADAVKERLRGNAPKPLLAPGAPSEAKAP